MTYTLPFVTVICTCYNHESFVIEALESVLNQTYSNVELIIVDNGSTDRSKDTIANFLKAFPSLTFINNRENIGICKAFNLAAKQAKGKYLIDLSADDILYLNRIELQVQEFEKLSEEYGLLYSNVEEVDGMGKFLRYTHTTDAALPEGSIFSDLLNKHFLPSPSTLFKKSVFDALGGYNETLAFEDFDFWIRCARDHKFHYLPIISTKKRILSDSLSTKFYSSESDVMLRSTLVTFNWAFNNLRDQRELKCWHNGIEYYFRQAVFLGHFALGEQYLNLFKKSDKISTKTAILLLSLKIRISAFYLLYLFLKK